LGRSRLDHDPFSQAVKTTIRRLRAKLGDPPIIETVAKSRYRIGAWTQLVSNLVDNAIRHNITGGRVQVTLVATTTEATVIVTNTGPCVAPDQVNRLLQPFQRGTPDRTANPDGFGLGLSIGADIAEAHRASLDVLPRQEGGPMSSGEPGSQYWCDGDRNEPEKL
jgi:signal transduction histidine kinase